jgi:hypothetical protein
MLGWQSVHRPEPVPSERQFVRVEPAGSTDRPEALPRRVGRSSGADHRIG